MKTLMNFDNLLSFVASEGHRINEVVRDSQLGWHRFDFTTVCGAHFTVTAMSHVYLDLRLLLTLPHASVSERYLDRLMDSQDIERNNYSLAANTWFPGTAGLMRLVAFRTASDFLTPSEQRRAFREGLADLETLAMSVRPLLLAAPKEPSRKANLLHCSDHF